MKDNNLASTLKSKKTIYKEEKSGQNQLQVLFIKDTHYATCILVLVTYTLKACLIKFTLK